MPGCDLNQAVVGVSHGLAKMRDLLGRCGDGVFHHQPESTLEAGWSGQRPVYRRINALAKA
ncbi:hypothetical protein Thi970DRAFT_00583 [Thiorhodovibrio frisius]|uniref:Uncharacterized protein n=1 Tax=Thiorhodovibrio frisius TaxID=631362 RepID=H8YWW7_9GAMM|nr:hypothetical protein Thi970DRAFT_00583 [Thiorhodovibrio frisius]WPL22798.1 hypothetical protein Thiofri_02972 [Thiorhodovibrio frisius]